MASNSMEPQSRQYVLNSPSMYPIELRMSRTHSTRVFSLVSTTGRARGFRANICFVTARPMLPPPPTTSILLEPTRYLRSSANVARSCSKSGRGLPMSLSTCCMVSIFLKQHLFVPLHGSGHLGINSPAGLPIQHPSCLSNVDSQGTSQPVDCFLPAREGRQNFEDTLRHIKQHAAPGQAGGDQAHQFRYGEVSSLTFQA